MKTFFIVYGIVIFVLLFCLGFLHFLDWVENCINRYSSTARNIKNHRPCTRHVGGLALPVTEAPYKMEPTDQGVGMSVDFGVEERDQLAFEIFIPEQFDVDELIATIDDSREMESKHQAKKYKGDE